MSSAENELLYIVRINTEGETELIQTGKILDKNDDSFKQSEKSVKKYRSSLKDLAAQQAKNGGSTASFNKRNSSASNLLIELSRGASDAQYGIRGLGNNLEQAANIGAQAYKHFGSFGGLIKGIGASMLGPTGIVVGITAITTGLGLWEAGVISFNKEQKEFIDQSDQVLERIKKLRNEYSELYNIGGDGFFDTEQEKSDLVYLEALSGRYKELIKQIEDNPLGKVDSNTQFSGVGDRSFTEAQVQELERLNLFLDKTEDNVRELKQTISDQEFLSTIPLVVELENDKLRQQVRDLSDEIEKEFKESLSSLDSIFTDLENSFAESNSEFFKASFDDQNKEIEAIQKRKEQQLQEQGRARLQFEQKIDQMRLASVRSTGNQLQALQIEEQQKIDEIKNNELITARQRKEAIQLIEEEYSNKRIELAKKEAEEKEQLDRTVADIRYNLQGQSLQALYSLQQGFFADNKAIAITMLALEKGLAIAQAIKSGALASGEAQLLAAKYSAAAITPLGPNPLAIAGAANAQAQVGNIARITGLTVAAIGAQAIGEGASILLPSSGSSSGSSSSSAAVSYRGFDSTAPSFSNPEPANRSRTNSDQSGSERTRVKESREIKIVDGFGNMVLRGQEEIDASGGSDYLRSGL
ncbi:MAG: hypothetical protein ROO71_09030 [Balneola sp.]